jgi:hypothetical protein
MPELPRASSGEHRGSPAQRPILSMEDMSGLADTEEGSLPGTSRVGECPPTRLTL